MVGIGGILFQSEHSWHSTGTSFPVFQRVYQLFHHTYAYFLHCAYFIQYIRRLDSLSLSRQASFSSLVAVLGRPERSLSITSLSPLWKRQTHLPTDIDSLAAINIPQAYADVDWLYFCIDELNNTSLFLTDAHYDRNCFVRLFFTVKIVHAL